MIGTRTNLHIRVAYDVSHVATAIDIADLADRK